MHIGLLLVHVAVGLLVAAHGSQKLVGWYGGGGLQGTSRHFEAAGLITPVLAAVRGRRGPTAGARPGA